MRTEIQLEGIQRQLNLLDQKLKIFVEFDSNIVFTKMKTTIIDQDPIEVESPNN